MLVTIDNKEILSSLLVKSKQFEGYILLGRFIKEKLSILFAPKTIEDSGLGRVNGHSIMIIPVLQSSYNLANIESRLSNVKKNIVHEYIHYLDRIRSGGKLAGTTTKGKEDYVNSPAEFNAFYQEGANEIEDFIKIVSDKVEKRRPGTLSKYFVNFEVFKKKVINKFHPEFIENLNKKYQRKLDKRLVNLYNSLEDKYRLNGKRK
jgi:hypothetical protein